MLGPAADKAIGGILAGTTESAVKKRAATAKKDVANLYKTQMGAYKKQETDFLFK